MSSRLCPGIYADVPIFYGKTQLEQEHWNLDTSSQIAHAIFLANRGVRGLVIGSTAELVHLSLDEKALVVSQVRMALDQAGFVDFPIFVGVIHEGLADTIKEIATLKRCGASVALVLAPGYFGKVSSSQQGLLRWYTVIGDASPLPVMISYFPRASNNLLMGPDTVLKLAEHRNIIGVKLSVESMSTCSQVAQGNQQYSKNKDFITLIGCGQFLLPAVSVGAQGAIDAMASAFPKSMVHLFKLIQQGDKSSMEEARMLQHAICRAGRLIDSFGPPAVKYFVCRALGLSKSSEECRAPLPGGLTQADKELGEADVVRLFNIEQSLQN